MFVSKTLRKALRTARHSKSSVLRTKNSLCAIGYLEFTDDVRYIVTYSFWTDDQAISNLRIFIALSQQSEYLTLAAAQIGKHLCGVARLQCREIVDQPGGNRRTENRISTTHGANGAHHIFVPCSFEKIAARSCSHRREHQGIVLEHRHHQNTN